MDFHYHFFLGCLDSLGLDGVLRRSSRIELRLLSLIRSSRSRFFLVSGSSASFIVDTPSYMIPSYDSRSFKMLQ